MGREPIAQTARQRKQWCPEVTSPTQRPATRGEDLNSKKNLSKAVGSGWWSSPPFRGDDFNTDSRPDSSNITTPQKQLTIPSIIEPFKTDSSREDNGTAVPIHNKRNPDCGGEHGSSKASTNIDNYLRHTLASFKPCAAAHWEPGNRVLFKHYTKPPRKPIRNGDHGKSSRGIYRISECGITQRSFHVYPRRLLPNGERDSDTTPITDEYVFSTCDTDFEDESIDSECDRMECDCHALEADVHWKHHEVYFAGEDPYMDPADGATDDEDRWQRPGVWQAAGNWELTAAGFHRLIAMCAQADIRNPLNFRRAQPLRATTPCAIRLQALGCWKCSKTPS